ncbi:MAG: DUF2299 family protein [Candidatus Hermodarchaeota archaeon]
MPSKSKSIEDLIHKYLSEESILLDKIVSDNFDFGYVISFPPGQRSQKLSIYKPKNLTGIFISIRFKFSQEKTKKLNSLKIQRKEQFFNDLRKYLLIREVLFRVNLQNLVIEIHEQIYPDKNNYISKNSLFKLIQKVFYCYLNSNLLLEEYLRG